nr:DUF1638 domain-containing protein [uncultured Holophaga sp.]
MNTLILACNMLKDELGKALEETGCLHPVQWLDTGETHAWPDRLRVQLQEVLDGLEGVERVLLAFGTCGNALLGLQARAFELVFPRVDDCISLVLGSCERRQAIAREAQSYFLTRGWVESPMNLESMYAKELARLTPKWGPERAERLVKATLMPDHYKRLVLVDTGAFDLEAVRPRTESMAKGFDLRHEVLKGTTEYLKRLLCGPWEEGFVIIPPGGSVRFEHVLGESTPRQ